ncbi:MAG TPA: zinc-ribbon domain-containing protein [Candidatus Mcinerneyibacterium sp.]|nr:zinc-ribbon domain-containing protein [Candidatus Mcinerneyibacterium sp.]
MTFYMCPQCGADINLEEGNVCEFCGYELEMTECVSCGKNIPKEATVCPFCDEEQVEKETDTEPVETAVEQDFMERDEEIEQSITENLFEHKAEKDEIYEEETDETEPSISEPEIESSEEESVISNVEQSFEESNYQDQSEIDFGHREEIEEIVPESDVIEEETEIEESEYIEEMEELNIQEEDEDLYVEEEPVGSDIEEEYETEDISEYDEEMINSVNEQEIMEEDLQEPEIQMEEEMEEEEREEKFQVCPECGSKNPKEAKFCLNCGSNLEEKEEPKTEQEKNICPECGAENLSGAKFCMVCGSTLAAKETERKPAEEEQEIKKEEAEEVEDKKKIKHDTTKVKVTYDNNNKFKYRFVFNNVKGANPSIDEEELETLMNNKTFVIDIPDQKLDNFISELKELDCSVEVIDHEKKENVSRKKIGEKVEEKQEVVEKKEKKHKKDFYLQLKNLKDDDEAWKKRFTTMITAMRPDITDEDAESYCKSGTAKIPVKSKSDGRQLGKVLQALGCEYKIIKESVESSKKKKKTQEKSEKKVKKEQIKKEEVPEEEKPKFLILSGVDKKNWVVRERLLEKLISMYPNMTRDIAEGIVTQPVVKLRVKNLHEAESYKSEFEDMGWNTRIEDVEKMLKARKKSNGRNVNVKRRKQIHQTFLKREKSKRKNILTTLIVAIFLIALGYFLYSNFFTHKNYVMVQAEIGNEEVEYSTSGEPVVNLRNNPRMDSKSVGIPITVGEVLELSREESIEVSGYTWYEVEVPGMRNKTGYIRGDLVVPSDKNGNPISTPIE